MSSESFKAFMAKVEGDQALREKLRTAAGDAGVLGAGPGGVRQGTRLLVHRRGRDRRVVRHADLQGVAGGILIGMNQPLAFGDKLSPTFSVLRVGQRLHLQAT